MQISPQHSSAILETDHPLTPLEARRIKADLQEIGVRAVLLPVGVTVAGMSQCVMDEDED